MDLSAVFDTTAFIVGPFPRLSQTFIYREFAAMRRRSLPVHLVSTQRLPAIDAGAFELLASYGDTVFCQWSRPPAWGGFVRELLRDRDVRATMCWMANLPHRSQRHRARALGAVALAAQLAPELRRRNIRYLHAHFADFQTEIAMALSRLLGVPYGASFHARGIYCDRNLIEQKIELSSGVITCTRENVRYLQALAPAQANKILLGYHGLHLRDLAQVRGTAAEDRSGPEPGPLALIAVGRLVPKKGFTFLLEAVAALRSRGRNVTLSLIGDGPLRKTLEAQATQLDLENCVSFLGAQDNAQTLRKIAQADVLVAPSIQLESGDVDGIPNVILEAMALGVPVVASAVSGIPEVVSAATGGLATAGDAASLAAAIEDLSASPGSLRQRGQQAAHFISQNFDVDQNIEALVRLICHAHPDAETDPTAETAASRPPSNVMSGGDCALA